METSKLASNLRISKHESSNKLPLSKAILIPIKHKRRATFRSLFSAFATDVLLNFKYYLKYLLSSPSNALP